MGNTFYISGCVFTAKFPETSRAVQEYVRSRYGIQIVRCCVPNYNVQGFSEQMRKEYRDAWDAIPAMR